MDKRQFTISLPKEYEELLTVLRNKKVRFHSKSTGSMLKDMVNDWIEKNLSPEEWEEIKQELSKKTQEALMLFCTRNPGVPGNYEGSNS